MNSMMNLASVTLYFACSIAVAHCNTTAVPDSTAVLDSSDTPVNNSEQCNATDDQVICHKLEPSKDERFLALGTTGYKLLIRDSNVVVDKTLWIKEVLEHKSKHILITCPRKWGKSVNLHMLKTFLEYAVDANGTIIEPINRSFNYKLFSKGELQFVRGQKVKLNAPFRISKEKELIDKYLGQYPVIYINFDISSGKNYADLYNRVRYRISDTCLQHKYMDKVMQNLNRNATADLELKRWAQFNMDLFHRLLQGSERYEKVMKSSLRFLTGLLRRYFNKRVFVLIDNYDVFLRTILHEKEFTEDDANKFLLVYRHLLDFGLNNNDNIEKVVLTSTMHVCPEFLLNFKNFSVFDALNNEWSEYFGFNQREVDELFKYANVTDKLAPVAHHRYGGYKMHKNSNHTVYNPWSIANFLQFKEVENFWEMTWDHSFLNNMLHIKPMKDILERLLYGGNVSISFDRPLIAKKDFFHLKELIATTKDHKLTNNSIEMILIYLSSLGYLTNAGVTYDPIRDLNVTCLRLPTGEVTDELRKRFIWHYQYNDRISGEHMLYFVQDLADFILNDNLTVTESMKNNTYTIMNDLPLFNQTTSTVDHALVGSFIHYANLQIRWKYKFNTVLIRNTTSPPDMILFKGSRGAVVKIDFDSCDPQKALDKAKQFQDVFYDFDDIKTVKFIGISVSYYKNIDFIAEILRNK